MERQLGKPLHIQAAEAFESPAFLQKLGMARADAERIFGGADWHQLLRDLVPIRGRISCADALAAFRPFRAEAFGVCIPQVNPSVVVKGVGVVGKG